MKEDLSLNLYPGTDLKNKYDTEEVVQYFR